MRIFLEHLEKQRNIPTEYPVLGLRLEAGNYGTHVAFTFDIQ